MRRSLCGGDTKRIPTRIMYLSLGIVCIVVGLVGILIPGLPTTPFVLLASGCFSRSSRRLQTALMRSPLFGPVIRDWRRHRGIRRTVRNFAIGLVATTTLATCYLSADGLATKVSIIAMAGMGIGIIIRIPVLPREMAGASKPAGTGGATESLNVATDAEDRAFLSTRRACRVTRCEDICDGTTNTILVVASSGSDIRQSEPRDLDFNLLY